MSSYILDKAYSIEEASGVGAYLAVVQGTNAGEAKLPAGANAGKVLGVTVHSQSRQSAHVAVRKAGIARVTASAAISVGAPVNIAGTSGKVKPLNEVTGTKVEVLGFAETAAAADGDVIEIFLSLHERTMP